MSLTVLLPVFSLSIFFSSQVCEKWAYSVSWTGSCFKILSFKSVKLVVVLHLDIVHYLHSKVAGSGFWRGP